MDELIALLIEALNDEWKANFQYEIHASQIKGLHRDGKAEFLKEHADDERDHAERLTIHFFSRGIPVNLSIPPIEVAPDLIKMLQQDLDGEVEAIDRYARIVEMLGDDPALADTRTLIEDIMLDEVEHQDETAVLLKATISSRQEAIGMADSNLAIADQSDRLASIIRVNDPSVFIRRANAYTEEARRITSSL